MSKQATEQSVFYCALYGYCPPAERLRPASASLSYSGLMYLIALDLQLGYRYEQPRLSYDLSLGGSFSSYPTYFIFTQRKQEEADSWHRWKKGKILQCDAKIHF